MNKMDHEDFKNMSYRAHNSTFPFQSIVDNGQAKNNTHDEFIVLDGIKLWLVNRRNPVEFLFYHTIRNNAT